MTKRTEARHERFSDHGVRRVMDDDVRSFDLRVLKLVRML